MSARVQGVVNRWANEGRDTASSRRGRRSVVTAVLLAVSALSAVPAPADSIVFTTDTTIAADNRTYEGYDVTVRGCTVTIDGAHTFNSLTIERNASNVAGVVTHPAAATGGLNLTITTDLSIQGASGSLVASRIDVDGAGFGSESGPGQGGSSAYGAGGGGHGGAGGAGSNAAGGIACGSLTAPVTLGSGGGRPINYPQLVGGSGGGAVRLTVGGTLQVDGALRANGTGGWAGWGYGAGGGSGGSLYLTAATLAGGGLITANAGNGGDLGYGTPGGGGAGGRIAVYTCARQMNPQQFTVIGGTGYQAGQPGTVFFGSPAITIAQQPAGGVYFVGTPASVSIAASTTRGALRYQWRKGGVNLTEAPPRLTGTQTATLQIDAAQLGDQGEYDVWLTDDCGNFVSAAARVIVPPLGDANCDGVADFKDINPFVLALSDPAGYLQRFPYCRVLQCDCNTDGVVDFKDINPFVAILSGSG
jgi:hypothetical protein